MHKKDLGRRASYWTRKGRSNTLNESRIVLSEPKVSAAKVEFDFRADAVALPCHGVATIYSQA